MIRRILYTISGMLPCRIISDGAMPYLERYYLGRVFGWTFYFHRFVGSDPGRSLHDHPWSNAVSFVLAGSYLEETRTGVRHVRWFNRLTGDSFHRVVLPEGGKHVWTLFCHGAYTKPWGFLKPVEIPHADSAVLMWVQFTDAGKESGQAKWWLRAPKGKDESRRMPAWKKQKCGKT